MATFQVNWDYSSEFKNQKLKLLEGDQVELDDDVADFIERDSPGCLTPMLDLGEGEGDGEGDGQGDETHAPGKPARNRQKREGKTHAPVMEPIDKSGFKAVVDKE